MTARSGSTTVRAVSPGNCLRLGGDEANMKDGGVYRQADLSGASVAELSFAYRRRLLDGSRRHMALQVSGDGGATWTTLETFNFSSSDNSPIQRQYDVSAYIAANTQVRFWGTGGEVEGYFYIDDVEIRAYTPVDHTYLDTLNVRDVWTLSGDGRRYRCGRHRQRRHTRR